MFVEGTGKHAITQTTYTMLIHRYFSYFVAVASDVLHCSDTFQIEETSCNTCWSWFFVVSVRPF